MPAGRPLNGFSAYSPPEAHCTGADNKAAAGAGCTGGADIGGRRTGGPHTALDRRGESRTAGRHRQARCTEAAAGIRVRAWEVPVPGGALACGRGRFERARPHWGPASGGEHGPHKEGCSPRLFPTGGRQPPLEGRAGAPAGLRGAAGRRVQRRGPGRRPLAVPAAPCYQNQS